MTTLFDRIRGATRQQREALLVYWMAACLFAYADRRFAGKSWTFNNTTSTYAGLLILYLTIRWMRKLIPIGQ